MAERDLPLILHIDAVATRFVTARNKEAKKQAGDELFRLVDQQIQKIVNKRWRILYLQRDDVCQEIRLHLLKCIKKYDQSRGHFVALLNIIINRYCATLWKQTQLPKNSPHIHTTSLDNMMDLRLGDYHRLSYFDETSDQKDSQYAALVKLKALYARLSPLEQLVLRAIGNTLDDGVDYPSVIAWLRQHGIRARYKSIDNTIQRIRKKAEIMTKPDGTIRERKTELQKCK